MLGRMAERVQGSGLPYPGDDEVRFERGNVESFGKMTMYGAQGCTRYMVRLRDGLQVFVKACDQDKDDKKWLRTLGRKVRLPYATREAGWSEAWIDVGRALAPAKPKRCRHCEEFFSRYSCGAATTIGECDCPKCQGYCECEVPQEGGR